MTATSRRTCQSCGTAIASSSRRPKKLAETRPAFSRASRIRDVLDTQGEAGRQLLYDHGYDVGQGFVDVLSQYESLEEAYRAGRLRDLKGLLGKLNQA